MTARGDERVRTRWQTHLHEETYAKYFQKNIKGMEKKEYLPSDWYCYTQYYSIYIFCIYIYIYMHIYSVYIYIYIYICIYIYVVMRGRI